MWDSTRVLCLAMAATALGLAAAAIRHSGGRHVTLDSLASWPMDHVLLAVLTGIVILLSFFSARPRLQRLGCLVSAFLAIFSSAVAGDPWLQAIVVFFAMLGVLWLMADYWRSLDDRLIAVHQKRLPRRWLFALPLAVLVILAAMPVGRRQIAALEGFMPSSGGRDRHLELASSGVGDGDHLVAGTENIQSFAPIEDAPFMTSHEPTLYDLFDDTYNEPMKTERQQRAISLPPQTQRLSENHRVASSHRPGKEFSLARKPGRPADRRPKDVPSQTIFQVKGRLPLHLKLESFDLFDGIEWRPEPEPERPPALSLRTVRGKPWLGIDVPQDDRLMAPPERHAMRIIHLDTSRLPTPNRLVGVHIADVEQTDFFRWAQTDILRLDRESLPALTTIHTQSQVIDTRGLVERSGSIMNAGPSSYRQFGDDPQSLAVKQLVAAWVADVPPGWKQIERVIERIRADYEVDPEARASANTSHAIAEFLLETRRGPDYLFASAAVWALRSLGYSARLVSGFYAASDAYDPRSGHAAVHADDVHFWAEVAVGAGTWASLEPTPGYTLLGPPRTFLERLAAAVHAAVSWVTSHPFQTAAALAATVLVIRFRRHIVDRIDRLVVAISARIDPATATIRMLWLLDRRCRRVGLPRPRHRTPTTWLARIAESDSRPKADGDALVAAAFLDAATRALYMPADLASAAPGPKTIGQLMWSAERVWSWHNLRSLASQGALA